MSPNIEDRYAHFLQRLLDKQAMLLEDEAIHLQSDEAMELDQSKVGRLSRMDAMQMQAMSQATEERRKVELEKIKSALQRIENKDYGYCIKCGEDIAEARLEVDPAAPTCIDCAK